MTNTAPLKVGIVGLGRRHKLVRGIDTHPNLEISAVCDTNPDSLAEVGDEFGIPADRRFAEYADLVASDIDVVTIATPIDQHANQAIAALDAGKHVLCEQTLAYTVEECQAVIDAEKRSGKVYMMAENYTYFHYMHEWRDRVARGELGEITYAEAEYVHEIVERMIDPQTGERQWRYTRPAIHYCAHTLGPLLTLMDDRVVRAMGLTSGKLRYPDEPGEGFADMEVALFQTEKGKIIKILRSQVAARYHELVFYSVHGTKGFIENGRTGGYGQTTGLLYSEDLRTPQEGAIEIVCDGADPNAPADAAGGGHGTSEFHMVREFVDAIQSGRRASIDAVRASDFTVPGLIAHESALQGGVWLDVPLLA